MKMLKLILWPFSVLFGILTYLRRYLYNKGIFRRTKSKSFSIVVGNLTVGGTGKTPMVKWLAKQMAINYKSAVLSRGYGRKTKGYLEVLALHKATEVGDEPLEMRLSLPKDIRNFVCEKRVFGIENIEKTLAGVEVIILDDAYQHLQLKANFYILLCDYTRPFFSDFVMPTGWLREFRQAAKFCDAIVITRCPLRITAEEGLAWCKELTAFGKPVFFSSFFNAPPRELKTHEALLDKQEVIVVAGLAANEPFVQWAESTYLVKKVFTYRDHFNYSRADYLDWTEGVNQTGAAGVLTTAKDAVKIKELTQGKIKIFVTETYPIFHFGGDDALIQLLLKKIEQ